MKGESMQNNSLKLFLAVLLFGTGVMAQEAEFLEEADEQKKPDILPMFGIPIQRKK